VQLEARIEIANEIPSWFIKRELVTITDGFKVKLWTVGKQTSDYYQTITNSPLQLVSVWMLHREIVADITEHIVKRVATQVNIDLDW
jgi:hypothetical protein